MFRSVRWPPVAAERDQRIGDLAQILKGEQTPDARTQALVALIQATGHTQKLVGEPSGLSRHEATKRAKEIAAGDWASSAVKEAITQAEGAIAATMIAVGVVTVGSS